MSLAGLTVLVTRPRAQAQGWCRVLQQAGANTIEIPVLEIVAVSEAAEQQRLKDRILAVDQYQKTIFVSQNAVDHGMDWLDRYWPQLPLGIEWMAIGAATARRLQVADLLVASPAEAMDSEALLALPQMTAEQVRGQKILIFRGCGGRPLLAEVLEDRGAQVDYAELYRRQCPSTAQAQLDAHTFAARGRELVSLHSGESLQNFHRLISGEGGGAREGWRDWPVLVPSQRVAEAARVMGFSCVVCAKNATDSAMLASLEHWYNNE